MSPRMQLWRGAARSFVSRCARKPVVAGVRSAERLVPPNIPRPAYVATNGMSPIAPHIPILDQAEQQRLRRVSQLAGEMLQFAKKQVGVGQTTDEVDRLVHDEIVRCGAYPSPLHYGGFPKALCSSVNEVVLHGIPDSRPLEDGDIVNIDISVYLDGFHGDTSQTFLVGNVDAAGRKLVETTEEALAGAIRHCCHPSHTFKSIGRFIEDLCDARGYSVVREYTGHGVGKELHCMPYIFHFRNVQPGRMQPGMAFTIEPAICEGSAEIRQWPDGWTVVTADGGRSAQAEHTILITEDGAEVLTQVKE